MKTRPSLHRKLLALLPAASVQAANVDNLLYGPRDTIGVLSSDNTPERAQLTRAWSDALGQLGGEAEPLSAPAV